MVYNPRKELDLIFTDKEYKMLIALSEKDSDRFPSSHSLHKSCKFYPSETYNDIILSATYLRDLYKNTKSIDLIAKLYNHSSDYLISNSIDKILDKLV
jgi:hypothetical protein